jgi:membrane associated rhomboid family serine protease
MALEILPISIISLIAIAIMVGGIIISYFKKRMITYALIITNFIVFVISFFFRGPIIQELGFRPIYLTFELFPQIYTLFTSMFVHSGFLHIFGNMLVFFFIGMAFEQRIGWKKFLIIYLLTGICGSLTHSFLNLGSNIPLVGASGAIFGIMGAFAFSYPNDEVIMPIPLGFIMIFRRIKVVYAVLIFAGIETVITWWESYTGTMSSTAHFAHIGGLISGVIIASLLLRGKFSDPSSSYGSNQQSYTVNVRQQVQKPYDFAKLAPLATTPELEQLLNRIKNETVPQVQDVWMEHFIEKAQCPTCQGKLKHFNRKIWCDTCDFSIKY